MSRPAAMSLDTWAGGLPSPAEAADCNAWLWRIMQSAKNKAMIARLEDSLHVFVSDREQTHLHFPPRNAFHRKVCYLVARRYGLGHRLEQHVDPAAPQTPTQAVRLVLLKTPHSAVPAQRLAQLADAPMPPDLTTKEQTAKLPAPVALRVPVEDDQNDRNRSTTFLRRPRSADGKTGPTTKAVPTAAPGSAAAILKSISEEDYRKARARIFKDSANQSDAAEPNGDQTTPINNPTSLVNLGVIAKGPVEGSTGFDRRRNRRTPTSRPSDKLQKNTSTDKLEKPLGFADAGTDGTRDSTSQSRATRDHRASHEQTPRLAPSPAPTAGGTDMNGAGGFVATTTGNARRMNPGYPASGHIQMDRQDPDFDRRYDKWAVRAPPPAHPQHQIPLPIFSQLLYPYAVQATGHHMHPSPLHARSVNATGGQAQQTNSNQYQSVHMQHAPSGAMMFQQFGQGIRGLTTDYNGRNISLSDHASQYDVPPVDQLNASHSREMSSLQHQGVPPQLTRNPSPAYGLDSTVDFPPLP